jgi:hypothetical protein
MIVKRRGQKRMLMLPVLLAVFFAINAAGTETNPRYSPEVAGFSVKINDEICHLKIMSVFVLPEEELSIEVSNGNNGSYTLETSSGHLLKKDTKTWLWKSPQAKGLYSVDIVHSPSGEAVHLNVFVMIPYKSIREEHLNGFRIGKYPDIPLKQLAIYKPPRGFIEVTEANKDTYLAPQLKQFLCKQPSGFPKYIVLREKLLLKLEMILEKVNEQGYHAASFNILSGYRTPYYNQLIGNVKYSRHVFGGAADIFIDENPKDDMMDDLNNDGQFNYLDADVLYQIIDEQFGKPWYNPFVGGLGRYKKTASHGPFVHIDVRGFHARWGT